MVYRDSNRPVRGLLLSAALAVAVAAFGGFAGSADNAAARAAAAPVAAVADVQNSYADVLSRVTPAVVTVRASRRTREAQQFPFMDDPQFREFFGERFRPQHPRGGGARGQRGAGHG